MKNNDQMYTRLTSAYEMLEEAIGRAKKLRTAFEPELASSVITEFGAIIELMRDSKGEIYQCDELRLQDLNSDNLEPDGVCDGAPESQPPTVEAVYDDLVETETYLESCVQMYQDKIETGSKNYPEARMNKRLLDFHVTELERIKADRQVLSKYF